jgi:hypothetical protein
MPGRAALAIIAALALLCLGFGLWGLLERHGRLAALSAAADRERALAGAVADQKALRDREAKHYQEQAREADTRYTTVLAGVRSDTARFVASRRVQDGGVRASGGERQAGGPELPESLPATTLVDTVDVQACGDLYAYAVSAHDWAATVGQ